MPDANILQTFMTLKCTFGGENGRLQGVNRLFLHRNRNMATGPE